MLVLLAVIVCIWLPYRRSVLGRAALAVGSAEGAAYMSGVDIGRTKLLTYTLAGLLAAIGGLLLTFVTYSGEASSAIGGVYTLNGSKAKEVVAQLQPKRYVLPMHYGVRVFEDLLPPDEFLDGQKNVQRMLTTNELKISTDVVPPAPVTVLLGWEKIKK